MARLRPAASIERVALPVEGVTVLVARLGFRAQSAGAAIGWMWARPLAIVDARGGRRRLAPVIDVTFVARATLAVVAAAALLRRRKPDAGGTART